MPWSTREREKKHEGSTAFSRRCTAMETQRRCSQEASNEARTDFRDVGTPRARMSVGIRRAIAADRSANDTAKQATMVRERDISAEHVKK